MVLLLGSEDLVARFRWSFSLLIASRRELRIANCELRDQESRPEDLLRAAQFCVQQHHGTAGAMHRPGDKLHP